MGKTAEDDLKKMEIQRSDKEMYKSLPMPLPDAELLYDLFRGKNVAIFEGQIIAVDSSLRKLHEKFRKILPKGRGCLIRYIEDGAAIYGFSF